MSQTQLSACLNTQKRFLLSAVRVTHVVDPTKACVTVLDNILTPQECQAMIDFTERTQEYEKALVNIGGGYQAMMTDVRSSDRYMTDDSVTAGIIWSRIESFVPAVMNGSKVVGLNERLRFLRYDVGQDFKPHMDGSYTRSDGSETSYLTLMVYLNGDVGLVGGSTMMFQCREISEDYMVEPRAGRVLLFQHRLPHSGEPVVAGRKYAIRTDVMYSTKKGKN